MCGIGGWIAWDNKVHPKVSVLHSLLRANQLRGQDASGIAYLKEGEVYFRKAPITATQLITQVQDSEWDLISHSPLGIIHTRAQTKGSPKNNYNNHPVSGFGWLVVHNGSILNDDDLYAYYKETRFAEVDTSAIPLVLSRGATLEEQIKHLSTLSGSATIAAWEVSNPRRLLLARFGHNDLYLFLDDESKILYFSSAAIFAKSLPARALGSLRFLNVHRLAEDKVVVLDLDSPIRTYKVTRRPFYHFYAKPEKTGKMDMVGAEKPPDLVVMHEDINLQFAIKSEGDRTYKMSWWHNTPTKPMADMTRVQFNPTLLLSEEIKCKLSGQAELLTAYGRWKFKAGTASRISREFRPRKALRKWWHHALKLMNVSIPAEVTKNNTVCDGRQNIESFVIDVADGHGTEMQIPGYMCPWCGVTNRAGTWVENKWRCEFCNIASWPVVKTGKVS